LSFTTPDAGPELTSAEVLRSWSDLHLQAPTTTAGEARPLSAAQAVWDLELGYLVTTATVELPLAAGPPIGQDRFVQVQVEPDGVLLTQPLVLTATVRATIG
jgi:hypothetical protein